MRAAHGSRSRIGIKNSNGMESRAGSRNMFIILIAFAVTMAITTGCTAGSSEKSDTEGQKLVIVTTLFPQYDFVRKITGDKAEVKLILPPGVEPHSYEPTPKDIIEIKNADLLIFTGAKMEPWVMKLVEDNGDKKGGDKVKLIDTSEGIELAGDSGDDPHIWLDPLLAVKMVDNIVSGLAAADEANLSFYSDNASTYKALLTQLDKEFKAVFEKVERKTILYGGHFAFGHFAKRYGLSHISPYTGFSPDAEPTPLKIAELIKNIEATGAKYIFIEELTEPRVAEVISEQTGAEMLLLHGAHNVSKAELSSGIGYIEIMEQNLERLKTGLGYVK